MARTIWLEKPPAGIGVQLVDPRREQPFDVWYQGRIHRFCATRSEAEAALEELVAKPPAPDFEELG